MIRLNTLIVGICVVVVATMAAVFHRQAGSILEERFSELERMQLDSVRRYTSTVLEGKRYLLEAFQDSLSRDEGLGKEFLAFQSKDPGYDGRKQAQGIRDRLKCDLAEVIAISDKGRLRAFLPSTIADRAVSEEQSGILLSRVGGAEFLLSYAPIQAYGGAIAFVVLGYRLNGQVADEVLAATQSRVKFVSLDPGMNASSLELPKLETVGKPVGIVVEANVIRQAGSRALSGIAVAGIVALLAAVALLYAMQHALFLRGFRRVLISIRRGREALLQGSILEFAPVRSSTREVTELSRDFADYSHGLAAFQKQIERKTRDELAGRFASQVVHDLAGSIAFLEKVLAANDYEEFPPARRQMVVDGLRRLRGVAGSAERKVLESQFGIEPAASEKTGEEPLSEHLPLLIQAIVNEKLATIGAAEVEITFHGIGRMDAFAIVGRAEFGRAISNLLDNAIEACEGHGTVSVSCERVGDVTVVTVRDNGCGIPREKLSYLGRRGFTFNKANGSGLGLWQAKEAVESWGGEIRIDSVPGKGSTFRLSFPAAPAPAWLVTAIEAPKTVLVLDDEEIVHEFWRDRFRAVSPRIELRHFRRAEDLLVGFRHEGLRDRQDVLLLCDYELPGQNWNGIQIVDELEIADRSILVTGHHFDDRLRKECERLGVRLLPKPLLPFVPLESAALGAQVRQGERS